MGVTIIRLDQFGVRVDYLPAAHGSSIFTRGETQSLTTVTLGSLLNANRIDSVITQHDEIFLTL